MLTDTVADSEFAKLRVTGAQVERDGDRLRVLAVPYVKPEDAGRGEYETLDPVPAMDFSVSIRPKPTSSRRSCRTQSRTKMPDIAILR